MGLLTTFKVDAYETNNQFLIIDFLMFREYKKGSEIREKHLQSLLAKKNIQSLAKMKIWKALLLVAFLVYTVHCKYNSFQHCKSYLFPFWSMEIQANRDLRRVSKSKLKETSNIKQLKT